MNRYLYISRTERVGLVFAIWGATLFSLIGCSIEDDTTSATVEDTDLYARVLRPPTSFAIDAVDSAHIAFSWSDESIGEDHFRLEGRVNDGDFATVALVPSNTDTFSYFSAFDSDSSYVYRLLAERGSSSSVPTSPVSLTHEDAIYITTVDYSSSVYAGQVIRVSGIGTEVLASATSTSASPFNDVALWGTKALVVGGFESIAGIAYSHAAVWESERWNRVGAGINHFAPSRIAIVKGVPIVGTYYSPSAPSQVFRWNGYEFLAFNPLVAPIFGNATAAASSATTAYFGYGFGFINAGGRRLIAFVASTDASFVYVLQPYVVDLSQHQRNGIAVLNDDVYIALVHNTTLSDPRPDTTLIRYDGSTWHVADVSGANRYLSSIATFNGELYGSYYDLDSTGISSESILAKWSGSAWVPFRKMNSTQLFETKTGLMVESYNPAFGRNSLDHWDGVSWRTVIELAPGSSTTGVAARRGWVWRRL